MKKEKFAITVTSVLIFIVLLISMYLSVSVNEKNKKNNLQQYNLVIYQYEVNNYNIDYNKNPVIYKKINFTKDLTMDEIITSLDKSGTNHLIVKDGVAKIVDASCYNHICMSSKITLDNDFINNKEIVCMPNGLVICLEINN